MTLIDAIQATQRPLCPKCGNATRTETEPGRCSCETPEPEANADLEDKLDRDAQDVFEEQYRNYERDTR